MASSVFFKFKSQKEPARVTFDGTGISVFELKRAIIEINRLGNGTDFDLAIYNQDSNEGRRFLVPCLLSHHVRARLNMADLAIDQSMTMMQRSFLGPRPLSRAAYLQQNRVEVVPLDTSQARYPPPRSTFPGSRSPLRKSAVRASR